MKGQWAEFTAAAWLVTKGYLIYPKHQDNDPIDLVAVHRNTGKTLKIDVKSESYRKTWKPGTRIPRALTLEQRKLKMKFIFVDKDGTCTVRPR